MLTIRKVRTFKKTVPVKIPSATTPDAFEDGSFVAVFKALSRTEIEQAQQRAAKAVKAAKAKAAGETIGDSDDAESSDREFLRTILVGVEGLGDEDGVALDPVAARDAVIEDMTLCLAAVDVFNSQWAKAKSGN